MPNANTALTSAMSAHTSNMGTFSTALHDHTRTRYGGGQIGADQPLVSMTSDLNSLRASPDDRVREIVRNAPYIASFRVPRTAAIQAAGELSESEREVVVPNNLRALSTVMIGYVPNPTAAASSSSSSSSSLSASPSSRKTSGDFGKL
jgi:hypothetical protein